MTVSIAHAVDTIWKAAQAGIYFPGELKGKLTAREGYEAQLGILARHLAAGDTPRTRSAATSRPSAISCKAAPGRAARRFPRRQRSRAASRTSCA